MVSLGWPIQQVQYKNSSELWLYMESNNPVISKKILCTFCRHGSEKWFIMKWLILDLLDVVWCKYDIHVFPSCHLKRYVGRNICEGLLTKSFSFLLFFLLCFKWLYLGIHHHPSSILARHAWSCKSLQGQGIKPFSLK